MKSLGIVLLIALLVFLLEGAILIGASFGAFLGAAPMVASGTVAIVFWGVFLGLDLYAVKLTAAVIREEEERRDPALLWSRAVFLAAALLSVVTGLGLAFGAFASCGPLYLSSLYHGVGLAGAVLGFAAFFVQPLIVRTTIGEGAACSESHRWWVTLLVCGSAALVWGLAWLIPYLILSGSINEAAYPDRSKSPYRLPFPGGDSSWVIQGNNSGLNHNGDQQFAYDFRRRCGSPVLAARAGEITNIDASHDGNGSGATNNFIWIKHDDQSVAKYLHIQKNSVALARGTKVVQGAGDRKGGKRGKQPHRPHSFHRRRQGREEHRHDVPGRDGRQRHSPDLRQLSVGEQIGGRRLSPGLPSPRR